MVVLLRWPDTKLPKCLAHGFTIAGKIEPSHILRPIQPTTSGSATAEPQEELLGDSAKCYVEKLVSCTKVTHTTRQIYDKTQQEIAEGLAEDFCTKEAMDMQYGIGQYRPLPRHVILQHGDWRPIDGSSSAASALRA